MRREALPSGAELVHPIPDKASFLLATNGRKGSAVEDLVVRLQRFLLMLRPCCVLGGQILCAMVSCLPWTGAEVQAVGS